MVIVKDTTYPDPNVDISSDSNSVIVDRIKHNLPHYIKRGATLDMLLNPVAQSLKLLLRTLESVDIANSIYGAEGHELDAIATNHSIQRSYRDTDSILRIRLYNSFRDANERGSQIGMERDIAHKTLVTPYITKLLWAIGLTPIGLGYALGCGGSKWLQVWNDTPTSMDNMLKTIRNYIPVNNEIGMNHISGQTYNLADDDLHPSPIYYYPLLSVTDITILHGNSAYPLVCTIDDSTGEVLDGTYTHTDTNRIRVEYENTTTSELWILNPDSTETFTNQTNVTVNHNLDTHPIVQILNTNNEVISAEIRHDSENQFTLSFPNSSSGTVIWSKPNRSQSFTDQTEIKVSHYSGYKPFVSVEDSDGLVISANILHNNTDSFIVQFSESKTGKIYYSTLLSEISNIISMVNFRTISGGIVPIANTSSYRSNYIDLGINYANKNWFCDWISYTRWDVICTEAMYVRFSSDITNWSDWKEYAKNVLIMNEDIQQYIQFKFDLTMTTYEDLDHFILRRLIIKWLDSQQFNYGRYPIGFDIHTEIPNTTIT